MRMWQIRNVCLKDRLVRNQSQGGTSTSPQVERFPIDIMDICLFRKGWVFPNRIFPLSSCQMISLTSLYRATSDKMKKCFTCYDEEHMWESEKWIISIYTAQPNCWFFAITHGCWHRDWRFDLQHSASFFVLVCSWFPLVTFPNMNRKNTIYCPSQFPVFRSPQLRTTARNGERFNNQSDARYLLLWTRDTNWDGNITLLYRAQITGPNSPNDGSIQFSIIDFFSWRSLKVQCADETKYSPNKLKDSFDTLWLSRRNLRWFFVTSSSCIVLAQTP